MPHWKVKSSVSSFIPHDFGHVRSASQEIGLVRERNVTRVGVNSGGMNIRGMGEEYREFERTDFIPKEGKVRREKDGKRCGNGVPLPGTVSSGAQTAFTPFTGTNTVSLSCRTVLPDTTATKMTKTVARRPVSHNKDVSTSPSVTPEDERYHSFSQSPQNDVDPVQFAWPKVFNGRGSKAGTLIDEISLGEAWTRYLQQDVYDDGVSNPAVSDVEEQEKGVGVNTTNDGIVGGDAVLHGKKDDKDPNSVVDSNVKVQRCKPSAPAAAMATQTCVGGSSSTEVDDATLQLMIDTVNLICKNDRTLGKKGFERILQQRERFNSELQWLQPGKALYCTLIPNSCCAIGDYLIIS